MAKVPKIFYTSDLHFYHEKVAAIRGFETSWMHDKTIVENWNRVVSSEDTVYILGDICADQRTGVQALDLINSLSGNKIIIAGNHDPFHPKNHTWVKWNLILQSYPSIIATAPFARRKLLKQDVMLSHFPYYRERGTDEPRDMPYRLRNEGNWLLHGHTHGKEVVTVQSQGVDVPNWEGERVIREYPSSFTREIHVGLDAHNFTPVDQEEILEYIR